MKQLKCEMCDGTDLVKQEGVFVCQTCGCKYSVEEAKKMMIDGTVRVDNSHLIENYLELANNAYDSNNFAEAESYSNKIIEIEPSNYKAWFIKGKSAGWQSTIENFRISESISAFSKAITKAPEEEKVPVTEAAKEEVKNFSRALISIRGQRFAKWPDEEEKNGFASDIATILDALTKFTSQANITIPLPELMAPIATEINQSVVQAWQNVIFPDYNGDPDDPDDRASKYQWQQFIERIGYCTDLVERAINLSDDDDEEDITRYENLIFLHTQAIDSCSWDYNFTDCGKDWYKEWVLSDQAINSRRQSILYYEAKLNAIKTTEKKAVEYSFDG